MDCFFPLLLLYIFVIELCPVHFSKLYQFLCVKISKDSIKLYYQVEGNIIRKLFISFSAIIFVGLDITFIFIPFTNYYLINYYLYTSTRTIHEFGGMSENH